MKRETIFIGFLCLLAALGFDAIIPDSHIGIIVWLAGVALWGVCTTLTLSEVISRQRRELDDLRKKSTPTK
jgi:hypothetical protein|uniref:Uncharacterized protein n=1 Tax=Myoviridae sp. ctFNi10 TaxID=2825067 RepID=A0A8S5TX47_9CAUD|nr:MAG TPA: hypothetical protein [Myoviridae sp. ctFNi10]DAX23932.1 MAG TPA: hypothetical protein [Caudoviricetes sp.]